MFKKSDKGYYFWEELARVDGIVHGFSTRKFGDMNNKNPRSSEHLEKFLGRLGVNKKNIIRMNQAHGNRVCFVSFNERGTEIRETDGLLAQEKGLFLVATFADCVPVLFLDKDKKIFGIDHAGWKGVYAEIAKVMVKAMVKRGSDVSKIMVGIGPSIKACCYDISKDREMLFKNKFPRMKKIIERTNGKIFLDLSKILKLQLISSGVLSKNIIDCGICTKDNMSEFYSLRGEKGKTSFGLSSAVIGRV